MKTDSTHFRSFTAAVIHVRSVEDVHRMEFNSHFNDVDDDDELQLQLVINYPLLNEPRPSHLPTSTRAFVATGRKWHKLKTPIS